MAKRQDQSWNCIQTLVFGKTTDGTCLFQKICMYMY